MHSTTDMPDDNLPPSGSARAFVGSEIPPVHAKSGRGGRPALHEVVAAQVRARQIEAVHRFTPVAMVINIVNAAVVLSATWDSSLSYLIVLWAFAILAVAAYGLNGWLRRTRRPPDLPVSRKAIHRLVAHTALLSLFWAVVPVLVFPRVDTDMQLFLAVVTTGMIGAGAFALASVPIAASVYVGIQVIGCVYALLFAGVPGLWALLVMLAAYSFIVTYGAWSAGAMMTARVRAEAQAGWQAGEIASLLEIVEENASEVFWELDAQWRLVRASRRLLTWISSAELEPCGRHIADVLKNLVPVSGEANASWKILRLQFHKREAFQGYVVHVSRADSTAYWLISGRPIVDGDGHVSGWRGVATDVSEQHQTHGRLTWLSRNDQVTGLANRSAFCDQLAEILEDQGADFLPFAVICVNVDKFNSLNDNFGFSVGDEILRELGARFASATRRNDLVARLGGDEFAVILRDLGCHEDAQTHLQRLVDVAREPFVIAGRRFVVGISVGAAICPSHGNSADRLLTRAHAALEAVKSFGGGHALIFNPVLLESRQRRIALECALRGALDADEFRLQFQPMVMLDSGRVTGFEALLRWCSPQHGVVLPDEFIPIAEAIGLMPKIGRWALREASAQAAHWPDDISVAVNVSALELQDCDFVEEVVAATSNLTPRRVELEITESVFIRNPEVVFSRLAELRTLGYRIAMDDFGSGYSALGYLRRLQFDTIKLDRSIVKDVATNAEASAIVRAVLDLARSLGIGTVAEGVGNAEEARVLRMLDCTMAQGFLISHPMPAVQIHSFLAAWSAGRAWAPPETPEHETAC